MMRGTRNFTAPDGAELSVHVQGGWPNSDGRYEWHYAVRIDGERVLHGTDLIIGRKVRGIEAATELVGFLAAYADPYSGAGTHMAVLERWAGALHEGSM